MNMEGTTFKQMTNFVKKMVPTISGSLYNAKIDTDSSEKAVEGNQNDEEQIILSQEVKTEESQIQERIIFKEVEQMQTKYMSPSKNTSQTIGFGLNQLANSQDLDSQNANPKKKQERYRDQIQRRDGEAKNWGALANSPNPNPKKRQRGNDNDPSLKEVRDANVKYYGVQHSNSRFQSNDIRCQGPRQTFNQPGTEQYNRQMNVFNIRRCQRPSDEIVEVGDYFNVKNKQHRQEFQPLDSFFEKAGAVDKDDSNQNLSELTREQCTYKMYEFEQTRCFLLNFDYFEKLCSWYLNHTVANLSHRDFHIYQVIFYDKKFQCHDCYRKFGDAVALSKHRNIFHHKTQTVMTRKCYAHLQIPQKPNYWLKRLKEAQFRCPMCDLEDENNIWDLKNAYEFYIHLIYCHTQVDKKIYCLEDEHLKRDLCFAMMKGEFIGASEQIVSSMPSRIHTNRNMECNWLATFQLAYSRKLLSQLALPMLKKIAWQQYAYDQEQSYAGQTVTVFRNSDTYMIPHPLVLLLPLESYVIQSNIAKEPEVDHFERDHFELNSQSKVLRRNPYLERILTFEYRDLANINDSEMFSYQRRLRFFDKLGPAKDEYDKKDLLLWPKGMGQFNDRCYIWYKDVGKHLGSFFQSSDQQNLENSNGNPLRLWVWALRDVITALYSLNAMGFIHGGLNPKAIFYTPGHPQIKIFINGWNETYGRTLDSHHRNHPYYLKKTVTENLVQHDVFAMIQIVVKFWAKTIGDDMHNNYVIFCNQILMQPAITEENILIHQMAWGIKFSMWTTEDALYEVLRIHSVRLDGDYEPLIKYLDNVLKHHSVKLIHTDINWKFVTLFNDEQDRAHNSYSFTLQQEINANIKAWKEMNDARWNQTEVATNEIVNLVDYPKQSAKVDGMN